MPIATTPLGNPASTMFRSNNALSSLQNLFSVEGLVAVVTGGGTGASIATTRRLRSPGCQQPDERNANRRSCTGIGLMIAKALEHNGAIVYIVSRRLDVLMAAASEHNVR